MNNRIVTTQGVYTQGVVIPKVKPTGKRAAIITFFPPFSKRIRSDEQAWQDMKPTARKVRKNLFRRLYGGKV